MIVPRGVVTTIAAVALITTGCLGTPFYRLTPSPERPLEEVAFVFPDKSAGISIYKLDEKTLGPMYYVVEVLPGTHRAEATYNRFEGGYSYHNEKVIGFAATGGRIYMINAQFDVVDVTDIEKSQNSPLWNLIKQNKRLSEK